MERGAALMSDMERIAALMSVGCSEGQVNQILRLDKILVVN
jgi:uncharacterized protein YoaH (UPF0181 family)